MRPMLKSSFKGKSVSLFKTIGHNYKKFATMYNAVVMG